MASPDIIKAVAKMFLGPERINITEAILEDVHQTRADAKDYPGALEAGQLLTEVRKLRAKLLAKVATTAPEKPAKK